MSDNMDDVKTPNYDDMSKRSWDEIAAPVPLPNIRFKWQLIAAGYKKADGEGGDHMHWYLFRPVEPLAAIDPAELPEEWKTYKVSQRFEVPTYASHFDAKQFYENVLGISTKGLTFEQTAAAATKAHPFIEADVSRRTWTDKQTGMQRWGMNLKKYGPVNVGGPAPDAKASKAAKSGKVDKSLMQE